LQENEVRLLEQVADCTKQLDGLRRVLVDYRSVKSELAALKLAQQQYTSVEADLFESLRARSELTQRLSKTKSKLAEAIGKIASLEEQIRLLHPAPSDLQSPAPR
jgi:GTP1/Obg family GTP-binding protein